MSVLFPHRLEQSRFSDDGMKRIIQSLLKNQTVTHFRLALFILPNSSNLHCGIKAHPLYLSLSSQWSSP